MYPTRRYHEDIVYPYPLNVVGRNREKVFIVPREDPSGIKFALERGLGSLRNVTVTSFRPNGAALTVSGKCDFILHNCSLTSYEGDGIRSIGCNLVMRECNIVDCRQRGLSLSDRSSGFFERNIIQSCMGEGGLCIERGSEHVFFFFNVVRGCRGYGVRITEDCDVTIQRNEIYNNARQNVFKQGRRGVCADNYYRRGALSEKVSGIAVDGVAAPIGISPLSAVGSIASQSMALGGLDGLGGVTRQKKGLGRSGSGDGSGPKDSGHTPPLAMVGASFSAYAVGLNAPPIKFAIPLPAPVVPLSPSAPAKTSSSSTTTTTTTTGFTTPSRPLVAPSSSTPSSSSSTTPTTTTTTTAPASALTAAIAAAQPVPPPSTPVPSSSTTSSTSTLPPAATAVEKSPAPTITAPAPTPIVTSVPAASASVKAEPTTTTTATSTPTAITNTSASAPRPIGPPSAVVAVPASPALTVTVPASPAAFTPLTPLAAPLTISTGLTSATPTAATTPSARGGRAYSAAEMARHAALVNDNPADPPLFGTVMRS